MVDIVTHGEKRLSSYRDDIRELEARERKTRQALRLQRDEKDLEQLKEELQVLQSNMADNKALYEHLSSLVKSKDREHKVKVKGTAKEVNDRQEEFTSKTK